MPFDARRRGATGLGNLDTAFLELSGAQCPFPCQGSGEIKTAEDVTEEGCSFVDLYHQGGDDFACVYRTPLGKTGVIGRFAEQVHPDLRRDILRGQQVERPEYLPLHWE